MDEGVCVMDAADFAENIPGRDSAYQYIPDYGKFESAMKAFPSTAVYEEKDWTKGPGSQPCVPCMGRRGRKLPPGYPYFSGKCTDLRRTSPHGRCSQ